MDTAQLLNDAEQLPPEAQREVIDFVAFLKNRYQADKPQPQISTGDKNIDPSRLFGV